MLRVSVIQAQNLFQFSRQKPKVTLLLTLLTKQRMGTTILRQAVFDREGLLNCTSNL